MRRSTMSETSSLKSVAEQSAAEPLLLYSNIVVAVAVLQILNRGCKTRVTKPLCEAIRFNVTRYCS